MSLDIDLKISLLNGVVGDPKIVAAMLHRQPTLLTTAEVTLQARRRRPCRSS
jgi:hypothetical protein